jgi:PPOX class probable F420-dependent enzyme
MEKMDRTEALDRLALARIGHLATTRSDGRPHVVPVTFAVLDDVVVTMVDHKPKTTYQLQRLANISSNGHAALLVDSYTEDWDRLWWVRVDGDAAVANEGDLWSAARDALSAKYGQYKNQLPTGALITIDVDNVTFWESRH